MIFKRESISHPHERESFNRGWKLGVRREREDFEAEGRGVGKERWKGRSDPFACTRTYGEDVYWM